MTSYVVNAKGERGYEHAAFTESKDAAVAVIEYGVKYRCGSCICFAFVIAVGDNGFSEWTNVAQSVSGCDNRESAVLKSCNGGPCKIIVLACGVAHDYFRLTDKSYFHNNYRVFAEQRLPFTKKLFTHIVAYNKHYYNNFF